MAETGSAPAAAEVHLELPDAAAMQAFGERLAMVLRPGDLVLLTGPLGAGKTTLAQGIGAGLGVRGQVASPTFIIARTHSARTGGPALVHVDAYRLGSLDELDALDLDTSLDDAVTVVEWGAGLAEVLAQDRLEIRIDRPHGGLADPGPDPGPGPESDPSSGTRHVSVRTTGSRWVGVDLPAVAH